MVNHKKYVLSNSESVQCNFFSFLITWRSSSSKSIALYTISWKSDDFSLRYGDISILKWRPSAILELFYHHSRPPTKSLQLPVKFHVNLIHRSEDIAIWIFRIFGLKCLFRPPKWGFWGLWAPKCDYSSSRFQKTHTYVNPRLLSYKL